MRVGLHHGRRDPPARRREHDRAAHVAAAAEHDVGLTSREDPLAGSRRGQSVEQRVCLREPGPPGQAAHAKGVELEAGFRNEPSLGAFRRPGERHSCSAAAKGLRYGERGQHVAGCPPGCDQAGWRVVFRHCPRC